jgi:hypothetical protein
MSPDFNGKHRAPTRADVRPDADAWITAMREELVSQNLQPCTAIVLCWCCQFTIAAPSQRYIFFKLLVILTEVSVSDAVLAHVAAKCLILSKLSEGVFEFCALPSIQPASDVRWAFSCILTPEGCVERYKARFVAEGYTQK